MDLMFRLIVTGHLQPRRECESQYLAPPFRRSRRRLAQSSSRQLIRPRRRSVEVEVSIAEPRSEASHRQPHTERDPQQGRCLRSFQLGIEE